MSEDDERRIAWLDEHLPNALATLPTSAEWRTSLELYLRLLDGNAAEYQNHLSSLIELVLDDERRHSVQELVVGRLLSSVHSLQHCSLGAVHALTRLHDALSGTRKRLRVDFTEIELLVGATWALGFWSFERSDAAERRDTELSPFGESVSDRVKIASGLPFDKGVDKAAAEAARLARPIELELSDRELRVSSHALDVCKLEFDGNWDEFRLVFSVRSQGSLSEPCSHLSTRLVAALRGEPG